MKLSPLKVQWDYIPYWRDNLSVSCPGNPAADGKACSVKLVREEYTGIPLVCLLTESCPWRSSDGHRKCDYPWVGWSDE